MADDKVSSMEIAIELNISEADSMESAPQLDSETSPLLRLAPELRNRISEYVVIYDEAIDFVKIWRGVSCAPGCRSNKSRLDEVLVKAEQCAKQPALTQTCRVIRGETLPMFYAFNTFKGSLLKHTYSDTQATWKWLLAIGENRAKLQNFTADWCFGLDLALGCASFGTEVLGLAELTEVVDGYPFGRASIRFRDHSTSMARMPTSKHESPPQVYDLSPLLDLIPELRNRIYEYVVVYDDPIDIVSIEGRVPRQNNKTARVAEVLAKVEQATKQPALTQTCKTIRSEALPMFYGLNKYKGSLHGPDHADTVATCEWLLAIGQQRAMLKRFRTEWYYDWWLPARFAQFRCAVLTTVGDVEKLPEIGEEGRGYGVVSMRFKDKDATVPRDSLLE